MRARGRRMLFPFALRPSTSSGQDYVSGANEVEAVLLLTLLFLPALAFAQSTHTQYPGAAPAQTDIALRVCADPNDLPFSNRAGQGFENKLAEMLAHSMGKTVEYTWEPQRKQFLRDTLNAGKCDVVMALPTADKEALTTEPYYRSTYALVYRADAPYQLKSLDDPRLRTLKIGVHSVGDDWADLPGGAVLAHWGIVKNVRVYTLGVDFSRPNPSSDLIDAVAKGDVDVAIAWGPLAGYFAEHEPVKLEVVPLTHVHAILPFEFSISMAVRHGDDALRAKLDDFLRSHRKAIGTLLTDYGVPQVEMHGTPPPPPTAGRVAQTVSSK